MPSYQEPVLENPVDNIGSIDSIVDGFRNSVENPTPEQPNDPSPTPVDYQNSQSSLDQLEKDIDSAALVDKTPASIASFDSLKATYKSKISEFKSQLTALAAEKEQLTQQAAKASELESKARAYEDVANRAKSLETELETQKKELETNSYYRKKYDFENDPDVRKAYIAPMQNLKTKAVDILTNAGLGEGVWHDLVKANSEYSINSIIDATELTGMNARSLRDYVSNYKAIQSDMSRASSPEYIDSAIEATRGSGQRLSDEISNEAFTDIKDAFATHVREIEYSDINKEHNLFVHDKVVGKAKETFDALRKTMSRDYQNPQAMKAVAQASIMASAYPFQKKLVDHLMGERTKLLQEIKKLTSGPSITNTTEKSPTASIDINNFNKSIDDIVTDMFK